MAYIRPRVTRTGEPRFQLRWREEGKHGPILSMTFTDRASAERVSHLIAAYGRLPAEALTPAAPATPSFRQAAAAHLEQLVGVSPHTIVDYRRTFRMHCPLLLDLPITSITRETTVEQIKAWQAAGAASKTVANRRGNISAVFATATRLGWIQHNPCTGIRIDRSTEHEQRDMCFLTPQEYSTLLNCIPPFWRPLIELLVDSGARWGEVMALRVQDVDPVAGTISITRAVKRGEDGKAYIGPPKTRRSRRTVHLTTATREMPKPLRVGRAPAEPLFVDEAGAPVRSKPFWDKVWDPARRQGRALVDDEGAPRMTKTPRIHDLRYTSASWLVAAGVDLLVIQRRLGHESIKTTMDRYSHLMPDAHRAAVAALSQARHQPPSPRQPEPLRAIS